jgi:hypothetical protein
LGLVMTSSDELLAYMRGRVPILEANSSAAA